MRTTIEMDDRHRAELLRIASLRGLKGFSSVVHEALEVYLKSEKEREAQLRAALATKGSLSQKDAEDLDRRVRSLRETWR